MFTLKLRQILQIQRRNSMLFKIPTQSDKATWRQRAPDGRRPDSCTSVHRWSSPTDEWAGRERSSQSSRSQATRQPCPGTRQSHTPTPPRTTGSWTTEMETPGPGRLKLKHWVLDDWNGKLETRGPRRLKWKHWVLDDWNGNTGSWTTEMETLGPRRLKCKVGNTGS